MEFVCPTCNNIINNSKICSYCNTKLININDEIYQLDKFNQIEEVNNMINNLDITYPKIMQSFEHADNELNADYFTSEKESMIKEMEIIIQQITNIKQSIENILFDSTHLNYVKSMDKVFGDMEEKLNKSLDQANSIINCAEYTRNKINKLDTSNTETRIKEIHDFLDKNILLLYDINKDFKESLSNEESIYLLQNDDQTQNYFKDKINNLKEYVLKINCEVSKLTDNPLKIEHIKLFDSEYGSIENKITNISSSIDTTNEYIEKIFNLIEYRKNIEKKVNYDNKRRLDL